MITIHTSNDNWFERSPNYNNANTFCNVNNNGSANNNNANNTNGISPFGYLNNRLNGLGKEE